MSGGRMNYAYSRLRDETSGRLLFPILERLNADYCELLKSVEWALSGDTTVDDAKSDLVAFLDKWGIGYRPWEVDPRSCADCMRHQDDHGVFDCTDDRAVAKFGEDSDVIAYGTAAGACPFYCDAQPRRCIPGGHKEGQTA